MPRSITPMLTVRDSAAAIEFYKAAFGASEHSRVATPTGEVVAEMSIDRVPFFVVDENPDAFNLSPQTLGGTSVRMSLLVDDADAATEQAIAAGATEIFPVNDQSYGLRQGRVSDPSGHHWLIGTPLTPGESLSEFRYSPRTPLTPGESLSEFRYSPRTPLTPGESLSEFR